MVVYVEYVLLSNFFIDAFLAYITLLSLKTKAGRLRIALSALIGSCFAVAVPYINFAAAGVVKVLMLMVMTAVMCKYPCFKRYLLTTLVYFVYTAALGGAVLLINNMAASEFISALYYPDSLVGAYIAAGGIVLVYVSRQIAGYMARKRMCGSECKVVLLAGGAEMTKEETEQAGLNDSMIHVDFMVGSPDLSITGIKADGSKVPIFLNGDWAE